MNRIYYIFALFASVIAYGQVKLATAVEGKDFRVGEKIKVTFTLRIIGNDRIQETPLRTPDFSKFEIINSGSDQNSIIDRETNEVVNQFVVQYLLSPKVAGSVRIGSALVQVNGKIYKTEPMDLDIKEARIAEKVSKKKNVYINLELEDKEVFENEGTIAIIRAYSNNFNNLRNVGEIEFLPQKNVEIKPVSLAKSDIEQNPATNTVSQIVAIYMLYPEKPGIIELKPAKVEFNDGATSTTLKTNTVNLNVKSLPTGSPKNFKNTVGNYSVKIETAKHPDRIEANKPVDIIVKTRGEGNLDEAKLPKLAASEAYSFYKPRLKKVDAKTWIAHYIVIPKVAGDIKISTEDFSYFNPETKRYADLGASELPLHIMSGEEVSEKKTALESVNEFTNNVLETVDTPVIPTKKLKVDTRKNVKWTTVFGNYGLMAGFGLFILTMLWLYRRFFNTKNVVVKPLGSVAETENELRKNVAFDSESHLNLIKNYAVSNDYDKFFSAVSQMRDDAESFVNEHYNKNLKEYLIQNHGALAAENYQKLQQQLDMEKFAPVHSADHLEELYRPIESIFSLIK